MDELSHLVKYFGIFGVAFASTWALTPMMIRWGLRVGLVDVPNARRIHTDPVPSSGGLAVIAGFYLGSLSLFYVFWPGFHGGLGPGWLAAFSLSSSVVVLTGLIDDKYGLKPRSKLLGQLPAASLMYFLSSDSFGSIMGHPLPPVLDYGLTVLWFLAFINAFNLIDGLDGLCAGITTIAAFGLAASFVLRGHSADSLVVLALAGSALAFLRYNFHPARIFLGDTGSMFCGFALAAMALHTSGKSTLTVTVGLPLLAAGIPALDTALAIWRRSVRYVLACDDGAENPPKISQPDRDHLHHRLLRRGLGQRQVAIVLYIGMLFFVTLGLLSMILNTTLVGLFLILFTAGAYVVMRHMANVELWDTGALLLQRATSSKRGFLTLMFYPLWDLAWLAVSLLVSSLIVFADEPLFATWKSWLFELPVWLAPVFFVMAFSGIYSRVWIHSSISDHMKLVTAVTTGIVLSSSLVSIMKETYSLELLNHGLLFCLFAFFGVIGIRSAAQVIREWMVTTAMAARQRSGKPIRNVLLYGAGIHGGLYMRERRLSHPKEFSQIRVVGFIDDNPFLRKRFIHGTQVLGSSSELSSIIKEYNVHEVIVTAELSTAAWLRLKEIAAKKKVSVSVWYCGVKPIAVSEAVDRGMAAMR